MLQIMEANPAVDDSNLSDFERRHNIELPQAFRSFLLRTNGGRPIPSAFPITGLQDNPIGVVHVFFGLSGRNDMNDLDTVLSELRQCIPRGILPVASTDGGDFLCIDLRKPVAPIVFWDRRNFWGTNLWNEEDLYHVADSFGPFLDSLVPSPY